MSWQSQHYPRDYERNIFAFQWFVRCSQVSKRTVFKDYQSISKVGYYICFFPSFLLYLVPLYPKGSDKITVKSSKPWSCETIWISGYPLSPKPARANFGLHVQQPGQEISTLRFWPSKTYRSGESRKHPHLGIVV